MAATIIEGSQQVLDSIWEKNNRIWPEWLWDVSVASIETVRKKKAVSNKNEKPIITAGQKRIVIWTSRPLSDLEKETIPSHWCRWRVVVEVGSQLAYNRFSKRLEDEEASAAAD